MVRFAMDDLLHQIAALKASIDRGVTDLAEGRVRDFDSGRVIERGRKLLADHLQLSERDSLRVLDLIENPPSANAKLRAAAVAIQDSTVRS
jgi:uncharacterized protein (DUF1778 family)